MGLAALLLAACGGAGPDPGPPFDLVVAEDGPGGPRPLRVRPGEAGTWPVPAPPGAVFPGPADPTGHQLVLVQRAGSEDAARETLWRVDLTSGALVPLGEAAGRARAPSWSADGRVIVHERSPGGDPDVWLVDVVGGLRRLTEAPWGSFEPSLSPDGRAVVYASSRSGEAELWVQPVDGGEARPLVHADGDDVHPVWSPAGDRIAWLSDRGGALRAWTASPDGTVARPVPHAEGGEHLDLAWSPDGRHLALVHRPGGSAQGVVVVDATTGAILRRVDGPDAEEHPAFSPDGAWLACTASRPDGAHVVVTELTSGRSLRVDGPLPRWLPRWVRRPE